MKRRPEHRYRVMTFEVIIADELDVVELGPRAAGGLAVGDQYGAFVPMMYGPTHRVARYFEDTP